jgi:hypothetical protein
MAFPDGKIIRSSRGRVGSGPPHFGSSKVRSYGSEAHCGRILSQKSFRRFLLQSRALTVRA